MGFLFSVLCGFLNKSNHVMSLVDPLGIVSDCRNAVTLLVLPTSESMLM